MKKGTKKVGRPRKAKPLDPASQERADRAESIRRAAGFDQQNEFAEWLGIEPSRWNNVERGIPVSKTIQKMLVDKIHGLTRDYIEDGRTDGLPIALARRLGELPDTPAPAPAGRSIPKPSRR